MLGFSLVLRNTWLQPELMLNQRANIDQNHTVLISLALPDGDARKLLGCMLTVMTELAANTNTSITNMAEYLAADVIGGHFPERYEHEDVLTWIEQYPRAAAERRLQLPEFSLVTFANYTPRVVRLGGVKRVRIGDPAWRHISRADLLAQFGLDDDELD